MQEQCPDSGICDAREICSNTNEQDEGTTQHEWTTRTDNTNEQHEQTDTISNDILPPNREAWMMLTMICIPVRAQADKSDTFAKPLCALQ
jgi:hypothetical protein